MKKRILFISGSLGMGHVTRDLAVARALRTQKPDVEILWMAGHPASLAIEEAGEQLLAGPYSWADETVVAERAATGFHLNLLKYAFNIRRVWAEHLRVFKQVLNDERFDLIVGDETYEIAIALTENKLVMATPFVMIYDFVGTDSMTNNPLEKLGAYINNRKWAKSYRSSPSGRTNLFVGELEDIEDKRFGVFLPNRRDWARARCHFLGYIIRFDPRNYADRRKIRKKLGYGDETLVVCSIGGTSIGKEMLELCGRAYPIVKKDIPDLRMVLVCGPRLSAESLDVPQGIDVRGYVPDLYEHFAAGDLAVVQGGGTTTLELTALRRPFLFFPIEGQFGQEIHVARQLARHRAGVKMVFSQTTPETLAERVVANVGRVVDYEHIPADGARKAAQIVCKLLDESQKQENA
ncbi:MAG: glycosyltransferase [Candidatus Eisenbacteria bacterium]